MTTSLVILLLLQAGQSAKPYVYRVAVGSYCSLNDGLCSSAVYTLGFTPAGDDPHTQWGSNIFSLFFLCLLTGGLSGSVQTAAVV